MDFALPPRQPQPVTTIAWRLAHSIAGVPAWRTASHYGGRPAEWATEDYAVTAADALRQLAAALAAWIQGAQERVTLADPAGQELGVS